MPIGDFNGKKARAVATVLTQTMLDAPEAEGASALELLVAIEIVRESLTRNSVDGQLVEAVFAEVGVKELAAAVMGRA